MTIQDFARKYFGPAKFADPFISTDKVADVAEVGAAPQSNNVIAPRDLPTDACVKDFGTLIRPLFPSLKIVQGPVREPFDGDSQAHMTLTGPKTAAWLTFLGFNLYGAEVHPMMMVGPLVEAFGLCATPEGALQRVVGLMNFAAMLEPSPTGDAA